MHSLLSVRATCPAHLIILELITLIYFSFQVSEQIYAFRDLPMRATCHAHLTLFDLINLID